MKIVFSIASLSFEGDLPAALFHMGLIADWKAQSQVIAVFHTNAGHPTLHDAAYNTDRNISTGNPYRKLVTDLMNKSVKVELCGATARVHGGGNADTIRGIKINTDTMARTTQLVQEGFIKDFWTLTLLQDEAVAWRLLQLAGLDTNDSNGHTQIREAG